MSSDADHIRFAIFAWANLLEGEFGTCPFGREALLNWLEDQLHNRVLESPSSDPDHVQKAYQQWIAAANED